MGKLLCFCMDKTLFAKTSTYFAYILYTITPICAIIFSLSGEKIQMQHPNEGHRQRLRQRMIKEGLTNFQDHEVLEMLLFQFLPRRDTNKLAHNLLNKFGSFYNVLNASPTQLMEVDGVSELTACNIAVLKEVFVRYKKSSLSKISLAGLASVLEYSRELMTGNYVEKLVVVFVDNATNFLLSEEFCSDDSKRVNADIKKIVSSAVRCNAAGIILFHCHVDGPCTPSNEDFEFTQRLFTTMININIVVLEHLIFNNKGEYYSFFQHRDMENIATAVRNK